MSRSPLDYLRHILDETDYLATEVARLSEDAFLRDPTAQRAFVRSMEIIGEAAKHVPPEWRNRYPDIEWRAMAGMRDRMIHRYFGVDYQIVWDVAVNKAPKLRESIRALLEREAKP